MSTQARRLEAEAASAAFQLAMARLGLAAVAEAMDLWTDVDPNRLEATALRWLTRSAAMVMGRRAEARELAIAYYRLARALHTGRTVAFDREPRVTLDRLRENFSAALERVERSTPSPAGEEKPSSLLRPSGAGDVAIPVDRVDIDETDIEEADAAYSVVRSLELLGSQNLRRRLERRSDPSVEKAIQTAGVMQAASAERHVLNGGRAALWRGVERDRRIIGYARVSKTGTPCGFCAMLISRGFILKTGKGLYRSLESGGGGPDLDGDRYHDNCKCYAEPIYAREQFDKDPRFDLNREYARLWPQVTRGLGGKAALNAWRRYIEGERRSAQEAVA